MHGRLRDVTYRFLNSVLNLFAMHIHKIFNFFSRINFHSLYWFFKQSFKVVPNFLSIIYFPVYCMLFFKLLTMQPSVILLTLVVYEMDHEHILGKNLHLKDLKITYVLIFTYDFQQ